MDELLEIIRSMDSSARGPKKEFANTRVVRRHDRHELDGNVR